MAGFWRWLGGHPDQLMLMRWQQSVSEYRLEIRYLRERLHKLGAEGMDDDYSPMSKAPNQKPCGCK